MMNNNVLNEPGYFRALIIEDTESARNLMTDFLADMELNFEVFGADTAEGGIKLIKDTSPDIIILDLKLPNMDGFDFLKKIKQYDPIKKIPIIITSALSDMDNVQKALDMGANGYLLKPIKFEQLEEKINELAPIIRKQHKKMHYNLNIEENLIKLQVIGYCTNEIASTIANDIIALVETNKIKRPVFLVDFTHLIETSIHPECLTRFFNFYVKLKTIEEKNIIIYSPNTSLLEKLHNHIMVKKFVIMDDYNKAVNQIPK